MKNKKLTGVVSVHDLKKIPKKEWNKTKVSDIMTEHVKSISSDENAFKALMNMLEKNIVILPVKHNNKIIGILSREILARYIRIKNTE